MYTLTLIILLQGLVWPAQTTPPLGLTVHVVPQDSSQGQTVRAHFTAVTSGTCTALSGLCAAGEDCSVESNTIPFNGSKPGTGWCTYQWQKTVPSNYKGNITLGSGTQLYVELKTDPVIRANSGKLNQPVYVGLPPPLRARENCPHDFTLAMKDLDGDDVQCRFASADAGECVNCEQHSFIELDQESCTLSFTGGASAGLYYIYLMAEDLVPVPKISQSQSKPLSAVPVLLSLTVEAKKYSCSDEPVATADTPTDNSVLYILPFHQESFTVDYNSEKERVSEIAVVGPPELYRNSFTSIGPISAISIAWVRSENKLARLLPICFVANTNSLQSEPRCVWLYQREMMSLPAGTVLTCEKTEMTLILPITSFANINAAELQLNSPTCPVNYNTTHLTARIPLEGCGTKAVHSGHELIYTNTLQTVRSNTKVIRRQPNLVLPLACRIPGVQARGPQYNIKVPTEKEVFGDVVFRLEFYFPGEGPLQKFTNNPTFRSDNRRFRQASGSASNSSSSSDAIRVSGAVGSKISSLDLYVTSNCTVSRAEILVGTCQQSATEDFAVSTSILEQGCTTTPSALEVITKTPGTKVYRLDLNGLNPEGSTMYVKCTVNLCITTLPSQTCPDLCTTKLNQRSAMVNSVFSASYTVKSGPVSLVVTTPPPITTTPLNNQTPNPLPNTAKPPVTPTPVASTTGNTSSHAPEKASSMAVGVIVATLGIFLHDIFLS